MVAVKLMSNGKVLRTSSSKHCSVKSECLSVWMLLLKGARSNQMFNVSWRVVGWTIGGLVGVCSILLKMHEAIPQHNITHILIKSSGLYQEQQHRGSPLYYLLLQHGLWKTSPGHLIHGITSPFSSPTANPGSCT